MIISLFLFRFLNIFFFIHCTLGWCAFSFVLHAFSCLEISSIVVMLTGLIGYIFFFNSCFSSLNSYEINFDAADFLLLRFSFSVFTLKLEQTVN